jgi:peptide/nickel transport system substrate-binding protein
MIDLESLLSEMKLGRMGRREFLGRAAALGATSAAGLVQLGRAAQAQTPMRGGEVVWANGESSPAETLDPTKMTSGTDAARSYQIYNRLINLDRTLNPVPNLAVEWEGTDEAKVWTFKIRPGVEFHNGKTLTVEDIIYSLNEHIKEGSTSPSKVLLSSIVEMKADGPDVLRVTLNSSNAEFPILLGYDYHTSIVQAGWKDGDPVVGTGPYKLVEFQPGIRSVTTRNENYWKPDSAWVETWILQSVTDATAVTNGLRTGSIDISGVDARLAGMLGRDPAITIHKTSSSQHFLWAMMCDRAPTNDLNVRLALKYCADRQAMVDQLLLGYGAVANDHPISPAMPLYCAEIPIRPYDPEKAKFYWDKTGLSSIEISTSTQAGDSAVDATVMLQEAAKAAGITIDVKRVPSDGYWEQTWMKVPICASTWNARPTADLMLTTLYQSSAEWNETQWKSDRFDELLVLGRKTVDATKRAEIYCEAQTLIHEDGGALIPFFVDFVDATRARIKNYQGSPAFSGGAGLPYEEVWVDENA